MNHSHDYNKLVKYLEQFIINDGIPQFENEFLKIKNSHNSELIKLYLFSNFITNAIDTTLRELNNFNQYS